MPYRKIGYIRKTPAETLIADAKTLAKELGPDKVITTIPDAIKEKVAHPRRYLKDLTFDDLLQVANDDRFAFGGTTLAPLVRIMSAMLNAAGYMEQQIESYDYWTNPILGIDQLARLSLNPLIQLPTKENLGGENAIVDMFRAAIPHVIRDLLFLDSLTPTVISHLRDGIGNIGFKTRTGQVLSQFEKSMLTVYADTEEGSLGFSEHQAPQPIPAVENANPLVMQAMQRAEGACQPGPGMRFFKLISNTNVESLLYYFSLHSPSLPLSVGRLINRGPFTEVHMERLDERPWSTASQMEGMRDFIATAIFGKQEPTKEQLNYKFIQNPPIMWRSKADGAGLSPMMYDLPEVKVTVISERDVADQRWEYFSKFRDRVVTGGNGSPGTTDTLLTDIALTKKEVGDNVVEFANLDHVKLLDEQPTSIQERFVRSDALQDEVYYVRNGRLQGPEKVDMRFFYNRFGTVMGKPALAEYVIPPLKWLHLPAENAVQFLNARLSLTREEALQNARALTICHNHAELTRLTGSTPGVSLTTYVKAILGL